MLQGYTADSRLLVGAAATLSWQPVDSDGEPAAPDGTVTVAVTRADGSSLIAAGTATIGSGSALRQVAVTAAQTAQLDVLVATWTDAGGGTAQTLHEIVGGFYFSLAEARQVQATLADISKYPASLLRDVRAAVEDEFEEIAGCAFVPRYRRVRVRGTDTSTLVLPDPLVRTVRSVRAYSTATAYTAWTADELAAITTDDSGVIDVGTGGVFPCAGTGLVVEYEHGHDRPPADLRRHALTRLREIVNDPIAAISSKAERFTSPEGTVVFSLLPGGPGGRRTGNPDIDAALTRYAWPEISFA